MTPLNYKLVSKEVPCTLLNKARINEVLSWLHGSGTLELNGKYRKAAILDGIEFTKHGMQRLDFSIPFLMDLECYNEYHYLQIEQQTILFLLEWQKVLELFFS